MTTNLTDRYVAATLRRVPEKQRPEIDRELRAAIADDVDARLEQGDKPSDAEFAALKEMGDPYRLAASYTNRSLTLIGPDFYPNYVRMLRVVCILVLPVLYVVLAVVSFAQHQNPWSAIFGPLGSTISVGIYIAFAITVMFAIAERASASQPDADKSDLEWTPNSLAAEVSPPSFTRWTDVITQLVGSLVIVVLLVADRYAPVVTGRHGHVSVLAPQLWKFWIPLFLVILAAAIVVEWVKSRMGHSTLATAIVDASVGLVGAVSLVVMVLTTVVVNPALTTVAALRPGSWLWLIVAAAIVLVFAVSTVRTLRLGIRRVPVA